MCLFFLCSLNVILVSNKSELAFQLCLTTALSFPCCLAHSRKMAWLNVQLTKEDRHLVLPLVKQLRVFNLTQHELGVDAGS